MTNKRRVDSHDLWRMNFVGDPQVSPDGRKVVYVQTRVVPEKNGYASSLWMAHGENGKWALQQFTHPVGDGRLVRDRSPRWSPDGSQVCFISNRSGTAALYIIPASGGEARLLTERRTSIADVAWSPDGSRIAFTSKHPEQLDPDFAAFRGLETKKSGKTRAGLWNGKELPEPAVTHVTRLRYKFNGMGLLDDRHMQLFVVEVNSGKVTQLTSGPYNNTQPAWSPNGSQLVFTSARRPDRELVGLADLWTIPAQGGSPSRLVEAEGPINNPTWSPDGQLIAYVGHEQGEFSAANARVYIVGSSGGTVRCLTPDFDRSVGNSVGGDTRFDAGGAGPFWTSQGDALLFVATDGGASHLYRVDLVNSDIRTVIDTPPVLTSAAMQAPRGSSSQTVAVTAVDSGYPCDIFVGTVGGQDDPAELQRVTRANGELLDSLEIAEPERFEFETFDGKILEAWVIKPTGFSQNELYPAVLEIHGGPAGTYGPVFVHEFQLLAARGYGVVFTNPRGSKGYGEDFARGVIGDWGGGDYRDLMACVDAAVEKFPWIDPDRLGVTGGSYGGYMTNWIVGQTNRFRSAVTLRSISNLYTKYGVSDIGFFGNRAGMGGADLWDSEDFIMSRSPIRSAPQVQTPILIIHSEDDLRCPMEQAEQWYVALKRLGNVDVEFVRFAGETHELSRSGKPINRVERLERIVGWFERYMPTRS